MIREVKFSNFYSFHKEQKISFLATKKKTYDYYESKTGDQITKIAGFVGGNASGKTNVMRFFSFLSYFVCRNININDDSSFIPDIAYKSFFNNNNNPSDFYIEFEKDDVIYYYEFSIQKTVILKETLNIKRIQKGSRKIEIFSRKENRIKNLNKIFFKNLSVDAFPKIREDVSFIAFIKKSIYSVDVVNEIYDYFQGFKTNINEIGEINPLQHQLNILIAYLNDITLKKGMENFICNFDVGLKGFEIQKKKIKEKDREGVSMTVLGIHSTNEKNNKLDFRYESRGTQSLFFVLANILNALNNNNIIIIDEIETGFHPEALNKLISFFIDENKNNHAQLIFSSHSLGFMNKLDMHQIFLVEKNKNSESSILRLNQIKNIRSDENFLAKYMSGAYGSFPEIRV